MNHIRSRLLSLSLAACGAFLFAACGDDADDQRVEVETPGDENLAADDWEDKGEYEDLYLNPGRYEGEEVTVSGVVVEVYDDETFRINTSETAKESDDGLAVIHETGREIAVLDRIRINGTTAAITDLDEAQVMASEQAFGDDEFVFLVSNITQISPVP